MVKYVLAAGMAITVSCLNLGDHKPAAAQPLEIQTAVHIEGPSIVIQQPLILSAEERLVAQQLIWECRMRDQIRALLNSSRNTDVRSVESNPLPVFSGFLSDAFSVINQ